jgi:hypothetical protein
MPRLIINPRTPQAREIQLKPGDNYLGRGFANDFKVEDPSVSGSHCQIVVSGRSVLVKDLGSTNGTFINRSPIKESALQPGQILKLGGVEMLFEEDSAMPPIGLVISTAPAAVSVSVGARTGGVSLPPPIPVAVAVGVQRTAEIVPAIPVVVAVAVPVVVAAAAPPPPPPSGLRLGGTKTATAVVPSPVMAPPPVAPTPGAVPMAPSGFAAAPEGKTACKFHPKAAGQWLCQKCDNLFCSLCVTTRRLETGTGYFCRRCGVECVAVRVNFVPAKEEVLKEYSDGVILGRSIGFAAAAALLCALVWIGIAWATGVAVPFLACLATGALCGYAVKLGCQDRPGVVFSLIAVFFCLVGVTLGIVGSFFALHMFYFGALMYFLIAMMGALFTAWRIGGGDF